MRLFAGIAVFLSFGLLSFAPPISEAPTGFDNKSNGMVDDATHTADQAKFEEVEALTDGLGPLYNAQSCRECHQNPTSGGSSEVAALRVGHNDAKECFKIRKFPSTTALRLSRAAH